MVDRPKIDAGRNERSAGPSGVDPREPTARRSTLTSHDDRYLSIDDLAALLQVPKRTIYNWRAAYPRRGPKSFRVGKHVRFRREDVDAWIETLIEEEP